LRLASVTGIVRGLRRGIFQIVLLGGVPGTDQIDRLGRRYETPGR
jgi:hypothetical protein